MLKMGRLQWSGMTLTFLTCLFVIVSNLSYCGAGSIFGVYCYVCDSSTSFDCFNPNFDTHAEVCQYGCEYNSSKTKDINSVIRSCGPWQSYFDIKCSFTTKDSTSLTNCYCKHDYCNNDEVKPGSGFDLKECYKCDYYGNTRAGVDTKNCLTPDKETPTTVCPYGHCKKVEYNSDDYVGVGRMCVDKVEDEALTCTTEGADGLTYKTCHCNGNLCNHGNKAGISGWHLVITVAVSVLGSLAGCSLQ